MARIIPDKIPTKRQAILIKQSIKYNEDKIRENKESSTETTGTMGETDAEAQKPKAPTGLRALKSATKVQKTKFSSLKQKTGTVRTSYAVKKAEREAHKEMKRRENELKAILQEEKDEERRKVQQRRKQKEENEKKGMVYQKITNTKKLKRLTKNQMKSVMKL